MMMRMMITLMKEEVAISFLSLECWCCYCSCLYFPQNWHEEKQARLARLSRVSNDVEELYHLFLLLLLLLLLQRLQFLIEIER